MVHHRLIHCLRWKVAFLTMWISIWGPWQDFVTEWWSCNAKRSSPRILSLLGIVVAQRTARVRRGLVQMHSMALGACQRQRQLTMPSRELHTSTHQSTSVPAWYTKHPLRSQWLFWPSSFDFMIYIVI